MSDLTTIRTRVNDLEQQLEEARNELEGVEGAERARAQQRQLDLKHKREQSVIEEAERRGKKILRKLYGRQVGDQIRPLYNHWVAEIGSKFWVFTSEQALEAGRDLAGRIGLPFTQIPNERGYPARPVRGEHLGQHVPEKALAGVDPSADELRDYAAEAKREAQAKAAEKAARDRREREQRQREQERERELATYGTTLDD